MRMGEQCANISTNATEEEWFMLMHVNSAKGNGN